MKLRLRGFKDLPVITQQEMADLIFASRSSALKLYTLSTTSHCPWGVYFGRRPKQTNWDLLRLGWPTSQLWGFLWRLLQDCPLDSKVEINTFTCLTQNKILWYGAKMR